MMMQLHTDADVQADVVVCVHVSEWTYSEQTRFHETWHASSLQFSLEVEVSHSYNFKTGL